MRDQAGVLVVDHRGCHVALGPCSNSSLASVMRSGNQSLAPLTESNDLIQPVDMNHARPVRRQRPQLGQFLSDSRRDVVIPWVLRCSFDGIAQDVQSARPGCMQECGRVPPAGQRLGPSPRNDVIACRRPLAAANLRRSACFERAGQRARPKCRHSATHRTLPSSTQDPLFRE